MSVQSDKWIKKMAKEHDMISPFEEIQVRGNKISFGTSSYGYDVRCSDEFKIGADARATKIKTDTKTILNIRIFLLMNTAILSFTLNILITSKVCAITSNIMKPKSINLLNSLYISIS